MGVPVAGFDAGGGCVAGGAVAFELEAPGAALGFSELLAGVLEFLGETLDGRLEVGFEVVVCVEFRHSWRGVSVSDRTIGVGC